MNINEVIKYPILSEKTYAHMSKGVYTFAVDKRTNKVEVKKTIEFIFEVKVAKINIFNVRKKPKKVGKFEGFTSSYKKAIIWLSKGQINIFPEEVETLKEKEKKETEVKKELISKKISKAEQKAMEKIASKTKKIKPIIKEAKVEQSNEVKVEQSNEVKVEQSKETKAKQSKETKAKQSKETKAKQSKETKAKQSKETKKE